MKEELLNILNVKLDDININIDTLTELNKKISVADDKLSYIKEMLDKFKDNDKYNVLNLTRFSKEEFDNVLSVVKSDVSDIFKTKNCNYDGLIYLINGINNGVSLSLTIEQENAINYLINSMEEVMRSDMAMVDGLDLVKMGFAVSDVDVLNERKKQYEAIIDKLNNNKYISEVDDIKEAIEFSGLDSLDVNHILVYLLKYNSDVYAKEYEEKSLNVKEDVLEKNQDDTTVEDRNLNFAPENDDKIVFENEIKNNDDALNDDVEFHLPEFNTIEETDANVVPDVPFVPEVTDDMVIVPDTKSEVKNDLEDNDISDNIDEDFSDIVPTDDYEEYKGLDETISITPVGNEKASTRELQRLFQDYDIQIEDSELNEYTDGNIDEYRKVIGILKTNGILNNITKNKDIFKNVIIGSKENEIVNVLNIIKNDLSVDSEDYDTTVNVAIDTIPSIFVNVGGNYENFIQNVKLYRELGINLVNLFDFSKEVLIANNDSVLANYEIVKEYGINIDYKNAKYFLLLDDIAERIDYYVESVYKDENTGDTFDGSKYIIDYPNKLNMVSSETIKRLRYSSENGRKVFGSKPNSLTGEITNLKVNVLDIPTEYMNSFFDNNFDDITIDEVRQYSKLCKNSSNVGNYIDELSFLEKYHDNLRYDIEGIKISYNKVVRCYNTLRSYGIDKKKTLEYSFCHNLIITKDEYMKLKSILKEGAGE